MKAKKDYAGILFALNEGLHGNIDGPTKRLFRYLYVHRRLRPYTAVMSNYVEPKLWFSELELAEDAK